MTLSKEHRANIEAAIKATEYKYFGMYEFTEAQHDAVDLLVSVAQAMLDDEARADAGKDAALTDEQMREIAIDTKALECGFRYVYAGDDHYLYASREQAEAMLTDLLNIRVEIEESANKEPK
jgi:hypothetical protein